MLSTLGRARSVTLRFCRHRFSS